MKFHKKYRHVGNSYADASVPAGWIPIVKKAIIEIEKLMWPRWMPKFLKRLIHHLATGGSFVKIKYYWAYKLRGKLTKHCIIQDIKEKFASLRIYGSFTYEMQNVITEAERECNITCQQCSSKEEVKNVTDDGWYSLYCKECRNHPKFSPKREVLIEKSGYGF